MRRNLRLAVAAAALSAAAATALTAAAPPIPAVARPRAGTPRTPLEHIVFVIKENRSFDHYFGALPDPGGDINGSTIAKCYRKATPWIVESFEMPGAPDPMPQDVAHANSTFYTAYHGGKMDGFCHEKGAIVSGTGQDIADTQMKAGDIPGYWAYAERYGLADRMFASWRGASFANNVFAVAAQTGRYDASIGRKAIYGNPQDPSPQKTVSWGCDQGAGTTVSMIDLQGALSSRFPCFGFKSLPDLLDEHGLSWTFYGTQGDSHFVHSGVAAIQSLRCAPGDAPPCEQANPYWDAHVKDGPRFLDDARAGRLPAVSWFLPKETEHPPKTACAGENATIRAVDAVMNGPDWRSTAVVIWWDEWGGFYDHVKPPQAKGVDDGITGINELISYGIRVPLLVVSPWVKQGPLESGGYVSHAFYSHASFARFVEWAFRLPTLDAADDLAHYLDGEPKPANLSDFFDFSDPENPPKDTLVLPTRTCPSLSPEQKAYIRTWDPD